jgi:hypothetical protein
MMRLASASDENTCSLRHSSRSLPIEAFHEAVLLRLAGRDVVPFDAVDRGPLEHRVGRELGAVVGDDQQRLVVLGEEPIEHADMGEARVGTKERLSDRTKELMKEVRRRELLQEWLKERGRKYRCIDQGRTAP